MSEVNDYCYITYVLVCIYLLGIVPSIFYLSIGLITSPLSQIIRRREKSEMNDLFITSVPIVQYIEVWNRNEKLIELDRKIREWRAWIIYYRCSVESLDCAMRNVELLILLVEVFKASQSRFQFLKMFVIRALWLRASTTKDGLQLYGRMMSLIRRCWTLILVSRRSLARFLSFYLSWFWYLLGLEFFRV